VLGDQILICTHSQLLLTSLVSGRPATKAGASVL
jgi:hypothetical protein